MGAEEEIATDFDFDKNSFLFTMAKLKCAIKFKPVTQIIVALYSNSN